MSSLPDTKTFFQHAPGHFLFRLIVRFRAHHPSWSAGALVAAVLFGHGAVLLKNFGGWVRLTSAEPLLAIDHGWHFYYSRLGGQALRESGRFWVYDPFMMAGAPTEIFDISDHVMKITLALISSPSPEAVYKITVFLMGAVSPLLFYFGARWFGFRRKSALTACLLGSWSWLAAGGLFFLKIGLCGFVLAALFGVCLSALVCRFTRRDSWRERAGLAVGGPLALLIHPGIAPVVAGGAGTWYLLSWRRLSLRQHLYLGFAAGLSIGANLFWIAPYVRNLEFAVPAATHLQNPMIIAAFLFESLQQYNFFPFLLPAAAAAGLRALRRSGRIDLFRLFLGGSLVFGAIAVCGKWIPLPFVRSIQPVRYILALVFVLVFPAAFWFAEGSAREGPAGGPGQLCTWRRAAIAGTIVCFVIYAVVQLRAPLDREYVGFSSESARVLRWIREHADPSARVLVEDNFTGQYPLATIASYARIELIGGPHWAAHLENHYADISGYTVFGKIYYQWDRAGLAAAMDHYNIGWVIVHSSWFAVLFEDNPDLYRPLAAEGGYRLYRVNRPHSYVLGGRGRVHADYDRIIVRDAAADGGRVVLSYHWHPALTCELPCRVVRVPMGEDPVGFIGLENAGPEIVITNRGRWR